MSVLIGRKTGSLNLVLLCSPIFANHRCHTHALRLPSPRCDAWPILGIGICWDLPNVHPGISISRHSYFSL
ncbi:hypothetical protein F4680DRAFT_425431 [Xylaria scruposa]|nr:hypothetical protein F4680DRAFT_425431 [Xylaria scruposa]